VKARDVVGAGAFGLDTLPYGVFSPASRAAGAQARVGVAIGDKVLDLAAFFDDPVFAKPTLNAFMAQGRARWTAVRSRIHEAVDAFGAAEEAARLRECMFAQADVVMRQPIDVADFVDFNSSLQHVINVGQILRPGEEPVRANWRQQPVGYHGRAGTVVSSGDPVRRPHGQLIEGQEPVLAPTKKLDVEAELGFVVGVGSVLGEQVPIQHFPDHVFGVVLLLDWSARDIQAFEYVPLGPFLGKSFATTISAWVLPLEALEAARVPAPVQSPTPLAYLRTGEPWALDVRLEFAVNGCVVSRPRFETMYWTAAQQLAHMTVNGASLRTGDLFGSGTISDAAEFGSMLELSWDGERPLRLADGSVRSYLEDGDVVTLTATAPGHHGDESWLGVVSGTITPALPDVTTISAARHGWRRPPE
jgi:fumarylacetoacetase